jgi:hypothetical protein
VKSKVIIKRPDEDYGHVCHISTSLANLQKTVGGHIEVIPAVKDAIIICNEEGKLLNLPPNMWYYHDMLCGTIIVIGSKGEDFADCPISFDIWKKFVDSQAQFGGGKYV